VTPDQWRQIEALYHAALTRGPSDRARFLTEACSGDDSLRQEVESLAQARSADGFLDGPAIMVAATDVPGDRIDESSDDLHLPAK